MRKTAAGTYESSFKNADGVPLTIDQANAVFTICSWEKDRNGKRNRTGGHASCYLEYVDRNKSGRFEFRMTRYDLWLAGHGKVTIRTDDVQTFYYHDKASTIEGLVQKLDGYKENMKHHSYRITLAQAHAVQQSVDKFVRKIKSKRYVYSLAGGHLGRVTNFLRGKRGVNCADFTLKILSDADIAVVHDKLINTPRFASGSSNR